MKSARSRSFFPLALLLGALGGAPLGASAQQNDEESRTQRVDIEAIEAERRWKTAGPGELPPLPEEDALLVFTPPEERPGYEYFIDGKSHRVDANGIVHYVVVLRSPTGVDNYFYEAVRCRSGEHREYAYGVPGEGFRAHAPRGGQGGGWRELPRRGVFAYRKWLRDQVFCEDLFPLESKEVRRRLRDYAGR